MTDLVLTHVRGRIAEIVINRPEVKNSLNRATIQSLTVAFRNFGTDQNIRVIIFRGAGDSAFCSGADLSELHQAGSDQEREDFFNGLSTLIQTMHETPQPIISMVHGYALAGGCGLAAAADISLASDEAVFGLPELQIGLLPMVVLPVIERAVGRRAASDLVLSAERIKAAEALRIGLVSRVIPRADLERETERLASRITTLAPQAARLAKQTLYRVGESEYFECLKQTPKTIATLSAEAEAREGIAAFMEKRSPDWK